MVSNRIIQLGGTPLTSPRKWFEMSNCGYNEPADPFVRKILDQNIKGEQCAVSVYNALIAEVNAKDPATHSMAVAILQDEVEHEEDLRALAEDLEIVMKGRA